MVVRGIDDSGNYDPRHVSKLGKGRTWPVYRRLLGYVLKHKARLLVAIVFGCFVAGSMGAILIGAKSYIDVVFAEDPADVAAFQDKLVSALDGKLPWPRETLEEQASGLIEYLRTDQMRAMKWLAGIILAVAVFMGLSRFLQEYLSASVATFVTIQLGNEMFENIIRMPLAFFEKHPTGEITARLTNDIFMAGRGLSQVFMKLLREPVKALVFLGTALYFDWQLTLIGLAVLPPVAYVIVKVGQSVRKRMRRSLQKVASLQSTAKESVSGIAIVKSFCMENIVAERMRHEYHKLRRQGLKMLKADAAIGPLTELVMTCGFVVFIVMSAHKVIVTKELELSGLTALYLSLGGLFDPVRKLSAVNNAIQSSVASAERAFEFIDAKPDIVEAPDAVELAPIQESLRFNDVHFTYDGETPVLEGVDFEVTKGEMVAVVGFSGAGKSTVAKLVPRFYDVTGGSVTIDGVDIRQATLRSLRGQISIVTQETFLFNQSVAMNIAAGQTTYSEGRIRDAAKAAYADAFVERLPMGYETPVGEAGGRLSGGQRQRLAIARALIKDPAILILDEATSSLDSESEKAIQQAVEEFIVGRTTIVIAHRLSTIQKADRILVLDKGRVVEQGSHEQLLSHEGSLYRRLYETQFAPGTEGA